MVSEDDLRVLADGGAVWLDGKYTINPSYHTLMVQG